MFHPFGHLFRIVVVIAVVASACAPSEKEARTNVALEQLEQINPTPMDRSSLAEQALDKCLTEAGYDFERTLGDPDGRAAGARQMRTLIDCEPDLDQLDLFVDSMSGGLELDVDHEIDVSRDESACLIRYILDNSDDPARTLAAVETDDDVATFFAGLDGCFSAENLAVLYREAGSQNYGDNARLDLMFDGCAEGDLRHCDLLALESAIGSGYFEFGATCGGAPAATETSCSPEGALGSAAGLGTSDRPGLGVLSTDCVAGDLTACDLLYLIAPIGSEFQNTGYTCAGRIAIGANPDCQTRLAN